MGIRGWLENVRRARRESLEKARRALRESQRRREWDAFLQHQIRLLEFEDQRRDAMGLMVCPECREDILTEEFIEHDIRTHDGVKRRYHLHKQECLLGEPVPRVPPYTPVGGMCVCRFEQFMRRACLIYGLEAEDILPEDQA